jgi:hypothetical protein
MNEGQLLGKSNVKTTARRNSNEIPQNLNRSIASHRIDDRSLCGRLAVVEQSPISPLQTTFLRGLMP